MTTQQTTIPLSAFTDGMAAVLRECFEQVEGPSSMFLDRGDQFFVTLAKISAEEASRPVGACPGIATQVNHTTFYIDVTLDYLAGKAPDKLDWQGSWAVGSVDDAAWDGLRDRLRDAYTSLMARVGDAAAWTHPMAITGGIAMVAHCAYHLGQIREALCTVQSER